MYQVELNLYWTTLNPCSPLILDGIFQVLIDSTHLIQVMSSGLVLFVSFCLIPDPRGNGSSVGSERTGLGPDLSTFRMNWTPDCDPDLSSSGLSNAQQKPAPASPWGHNHMFTRHSGTKWSVNTSVFKLNVRLSVSGLPVCRPVCVSVSRYLSISVFGCHWKLAVSLTPVCVLAF